MESFPNFNDRVFHVPSQQPGTALGSCITSKLVTVRFNNGDVLAIRLAELVLNRGQTCLKCGSTALPEQTGVCRKCFGTKCPRCQNCKCVD